MPLLEIQDFKVYYRSFAGITHAVDGISFTLEAGQSLGLVGESGCGKSTLARGIIRIIDRNAFIAGGKVIFKGQNLVRFSEDKMRGIRWKDLSLIPQAAMDSLNPVYPVIDAFNEILTLKGGMDLYSAEERAKELFLMVPILRDDAGAFTGFGETGPMQFGESAGRFSGLMPRNKPSVREAAAAKSTLFSLGMNITNRGFDPTMN